MTRSEWDQMSESLERDGGAVLDQFGDRFGEAGEFGQNTPCRSMASPGGLNRRRSFRS